MQAFKSFWKLKQFFSNLKPVTQSISVVDWTESIKLSNMAKAEVSTRENFSKIQILFYVHLPNSTYNVVSVCAWQMTRILHPCNLIGNFLLMVWFTVVQNWNRIRTPYSQTRHNHRAIHVKSDSHSTPVIRQGICFFTHMLNEMRQFYQCTLKFLPCGTLLMCLSQLRHNKVAVEWKFES